MSEPMGHIKHGKHILELKTRMSKYPQIEYPLSIIKGDPDLDGANFSIGRAYITKPLIMGGDAHSHDFDQILFFLGGDPKNTTDFDAEVEIFLGDKYELVNYASCVHITAGTIHCPLVVKKVNKPFIFLDITLAPSESDRPLSKLAQQ
ncbi:MAG: hypothetical protein PVJ08_08955 [Dehalococcoidia bacterium]|jgi:hypothetical protein